MNVTNISIVEYLRILNIIFADDWQNLLEECLGHEVSIVRTKAAEAHTEFFTKYYTDMDSNNRAIVINRYLDNLQSSNQVVRIGFAQAIGKNNIFP